MTEEVYYAISYKDGQGVDYFNGFRKHATLPHLMIKETKSVMIRKSFMKWKNKETAFKWLQKIKDETKECFRTYHCEVEKIVWRNGCWRTVEYVKE